MKVTLEKLRASRVALKVEISAETAKEVYEQTLNQLARTTKLPGFRKGKIPRQVLVQQLGASQIRGAAVEKLVQESLTQAVKDENVRAIGQFDLRPSLDDLVDIFKPGEKLVFTATVDVFPEVALNQYTDLTVQSEKATFDPQEVDQVLEQNRKQLATLIPVENRAAQMGDVATFDLEGFFELPEDAAPDAEPEPIPDGSLKDMQMELEPGKLIPGLVEGIVGMNIGETKAISAPFPADYAQANLAGRSAMFHVTLTDLKERELPELNDEFARSVSKCETLAELREMLEKRYIEEADQKTTSLKQAALLSALEEQLTAELPETLIENEVKRLITQAASQMSQQGVDINKVFTKELVQNLRLRYRPEAISSLKQFLAIQEIANQQSITVDQDEIDAQCQQYLTQTDKPNQIDTKRLEEIVTEDLLRQKVLTWLGDHNTIEFLTIEPLPDSPAQDASSDPETTPTEEAQAPAESQDPEPQDPEPQDPEPQDPESQAPEPQVD
jgi:trigger factor